MLEIQCFTKLNGCLQTYGSPFTTPEATPEDFAQVMLSRGYKTAARCACMEQTLGDGCPYELWKYEGVQPDGRGVRISYRGVRVLKSSESVEAGALQGAAA